MRKVGEILKSKRLEKNLTLEDVEKKTKIRKKFLQAIEDSQFPFFTSSAYLRGFIKNYSDYLKLPTNDILAIFRREHSENEHIRIIPKGLGEIPSLTLTRLNPGKLTVLVVVTLVITFFGYLIKGYLDVSGTPYLTVTSPKSAQIVTDNKVLVNGKTDPQARLTINNQQVLIGEDGGFSEEVSLGKNTNSLIIVAENKQGKKTIIERVIDLQIP